MAIFERRRSDKANADALNRYLDDLASGVLAPRDEIDADTATIVSHWRQVGSHTAEPAGLRAQIWEDLMDSAPVLDARTMSAPPLPAKPNAGFARDISAHPGVPRTALTARSRHPIRWLAAALLLLGLAGWGVIGQMARQNAPTPTAALFAPFEGTPAADQPPCSADPNPYFSCFNALQYLGTALIWPPELLDTGEQQAQLQGWAIAPGATQSGGAGTAEGVVVDFVINGAYTATFDVPVMVVPGGVTHAPILYPEAGETVELSRGDAVSYPLGGLIQITNPLSVQRLEFKRGIISTGDISPFSETADGVTTNVEGDTTIPAAEESAPRHIQITLAFVRILPGIPFPTADMGILATIGPVDPQGGPAGTEGFVLLIHPSRG